MSNSEKGTASAAALTICESLLIALQELKILNPAEARDVLDDAAATHRDPAMEPSKRDAHIAIAALIERLIPNLTMVPLPRT